MKRPEYLFRKNGPCLCVPACVLALMVKKRNTCNPRKDSTIRLKFGVQKVIKFEITFHLSQSFLYKEQISFLILNLNVIFNFIFDFQFQFSISIVNFNLNFDFRF